MIYITKEVRRFPFCHRACLKPSMSGMMSTWNKFCFTGGLIETAVILPGVNNIVGLWPAVWTMGNLGRAGFGASLEGMVSRVFLWDGCTVNLSSCTVALHIRFV